MDADNNKADYLRNYELISNFQENENFNSVQPENVKSIRQNPRLYKINVDSVRLLDPYYNMKFGDSKGKRLLKKQAYSTSRLYEHRLKNCRKVDVHIPAQKPSTPNIFVFFYYEKHIFRMMKLLKKKLQEKILVKIRLLQ